MFAPVSLPAATITQACKLALEQGLSLDGLASLLQVRLPQRLPRRAPGAL